MWGTADGGHEYGVGMGDARYGRGIVHVFEGKDPGRFGPAEKADEQSEDQDRQPGAKMRARGFGVAPEGNVEVGVGGGPGLG